MCAVLQHGGCFIIAVVFVSHISDASTLTGNSHNQSPTKLGFGLSLPLALCSPYLMLQQLHPPPTAVVDTGDRNMNHACCVVLLLRVMQAILNVFREDPEYAQHEAQYRVIAKELLGEESEEEGAGDEEGGWGDDSGVLTHGWKRSIVCVGGVGEGWCLQLKVMRRLRRKVGGWVVTKLSGALRSRRAVLLAGAVAGRHKRRYSWQCTTLLCTLGHNIRI